MSSAAFVLAAVVSLSFDAVRIPELRTGGSGRPVEVHGGLFRQADLNDDDLPDLVLSTYAALQSEPAEDGAFPETGFVPLPRRHAHTVCDTFGGGVYFLTASDLRVFELSEGAFATRLAQEAPWPPGALAGDFGARFGLNPDGGGVAFRSMLHDLDADGRAEIVLPTADGLAVYEQGEADSTYSAAGLLAVFPPLRMAQTPHQNLWPPDERAVAFPPRQMMCRYWLVGDQITVLHRLEAGPDTSRYVSERHTITRAGGAFTLDEDTRVRTETPPLSNVLEPVHLDRGPSIDFAGGRLRLGGTGLAPAPLFDTLASTDNGATIQIVRSVSFRPQASFADVNRDGRLDLVAHHMEMFEHGPREALAQALTGHRLQHRISVHLQDKAGRFSNAASYRSRVRVKLDASPVRHSDMFRWYQAAELFRLGGDVDGDGHADLVYLGEPTRISVHLYEEDGYAWRTAAELVVPRGWTFELLDVDGNGRDDIVLCPRPGGGDEAAYVYLSQEEDA